MAEPISVRSDDPVVVEKVRVLQQRLIDGCNLVPFNRHIGFELTHIADDRVHGRLEMRPELIGNMHKQILHGGVMAAVLDSIGGCAAVAAAFARLSGEPREERLRRIAQLGTIDMRMDFLRPGRGQHFIATAEVVRIGSKICATVMHLRNDEDQLIATSNAVYHY